MGDLVRDKRSGGPSGRGWMIATAVPLAAREVHASYSTYKLDSLNSPGANKYAIAYQHNPSKRVALHAS